MYIFDADLEVIKWLKENDKLFKKQKIKHDYPHCWRCDSPLVYYSRPSFYLEVTKLKDKIIKENKKINWYPAFVGEKRFGNWLENMNDWAISRSRYWGTPLPLWRCSCGHMEMIGSVSELKEKATKKIDEKTIDLHRPYMDEVHIKCPKCGKSMNRVPDVIDCWFDSGAMPFAQYHYPFENKELWESQYPADFIAEGIDQTRGWFYSLIVIGVFMTGKSPYKNVLVNELVLDKYGQKMHKSKGNAVEPFTIMHKYGADTIRFYLAYVSPTWTPLKFDEDGLKEVYSKYTSTLKNAYSFFEMYANADNIDPREYDVPVSKRELIDKWLLSKLNRLVKNVIKAYEEYDLNKVTKLIVPFLNDDLSNWYIRSNRRRFWDSELTVSKKAVYLTTYEVLCTLCKLCAPITPYLTEEIYRKLTGEESVHLADFPKAKNSLVKEDIEKQMDLIRDICSLGRFAREEVKIKVRQPIKEIVLASSNKDVIGDLDGIIKEELNVKTITYTSDMDKYMDYIIKPNFREVGKILGPKIKSFQDALSKLGNKEIESLKTDSYNIKLDGEDFEVLPSMVDISIKVKDGFASSSNNNTFVILNTALTEDLIVEGVARELVRVIQSIRKEIDLVITDRIKVYYNADDELIDKALTNYGDYIKGETLALEITKKDNLKNSYDINDIETFIEIEKN